MKNEITALLDVITPELFNQYMDVYSKEKSALISSGVAVADERVSQNITSGGLLVNMPFWNDLSGEDEVLGDGDKALSTGKITAGADIAAVMYRGRGWAVNELAAVISGSDPLAALMKKVGSYWLRREQSVLINVLNGLFAPAELITAKEGEPEIKNEGGPLREAHLNDSKTKVIDAKLILDTKQLLGDASEQLSLIIMHSSIYTSLQKLDLISFRPDSEGGKDIPYYMNYQVVVDDGVPSVGKGASTVYTTYLFAKGAIGRNSGNPKDLTTFETSRDAAKGNDQVFTRRAITMHPYGVKWNDSSREEGNITPTNTDLKSSQNWEKVYEDKAIGIVALDCKAIN